MTDRQCVDYIIRGHRLYWNMLGKLRGNELQADIPYCKISETQFNENSAYNGFVDSIINKAKKPSY